MEIYKGWYRKSLTKGMWHRVHHVDSLLDDRPMASTVCGRRIPSKKCDYASGPCATETCQACANTKITNIMDKSPILNETSLTPTKKSAVTELKRLLKPRNYYLKIWGEEGIKIEATWELGIGVDVYIEHYIMRDLRKKDISTFEKIQKDLISFKSKVVELCNTSDKLAFEEKQRKGLKGRLKEDEKNAYFEELMEEAEK